MRRALLPLLLLGTAACGEEFTHLRFDRLTDPPRPVKTAPNHIQIAEGTAIAVKAVAMDGGDVMDEPPSVELWPCNATMIGIAPAKEDRRWHESDHDDDRDPVEDAPAFVIWGVAPGRSCLRVILDGRDRESIAVDVVPTSG